jgi:hypothetical protein
MEAETSPREMKDIQRLSYVLKVCAHVEIKAIAIKDNFQIPLRHHIRLDSCNSNIFVPQ